VRLRNVALIANGLAGIEMRRLSVFSFSIGAEFTSALSVLMYESLKDRLQPIRLYLGK
jgi:hypothetical protein